MLTYKIAGYEDADAIAALHALSWQQNYRGVFSDNFLDNEVVVERQAVWKGRLKNQVENQLVFIVSDGDILVGFVCAYFDNDTTYGTLIDNLHVNSDYSGQGIGEELIRKVIHEMVNSDVVQSMYLWVLAQNSRAIKFYERAGGKAIETINDFDIGDREITKTRYHWSNLETFEKN
ncbi:GNAT family N-acetyltransferase [Aurantibacter sp.]|uniref:GNAT family N-acetyltransferase n=1 Tax=Aurantibacter sp. TaxID=2807103 RepID=UPI003265D11A